MLIVKTPAIELQPAWRGLGRGAWRNRDEGERCMSWHIFTSCKEFSQRPFIPGPRLRGPSTTYLLCVSIKECHIHSPPRSLATVQVEHWVPSTSTIRSIRHFSLAALAPSLHQHRQSLVQHHGLFSFSCCDYHFRARFPGQEDQRSPHLQA